MLLQQRRDSNSEACSQPKFVVKISGVNYEIPLRVVEDCVGLNGISPEKLERLNVDKLLYLLTSSGKFNKQRAERLPPEPPPEVAKPEVEEQGKGKRKKRKRGGGGDDDSPPPPPTTTTTCCEDCGIPYGSADKATKNCECRANCVPIAGGKREIYMDEGEESGSKRGIRLIRAVLNVLNEKDVNPTTNEPRPFRAAWRAVLEEAKEKVKQALVRGGVPQQVVETINFSGESILENAIKRRSAVRSSWNCPASVMQPPHMDAGRGVCQAIFALVGNVLPTAVYNGEYPAPPPFSSDEMERAACPDDQKVRNNN